MWEALFAAIKAGFEFASNLVRREQPQPQQTEDVDAAAQRAGTAAGAAANHASHIANGGQHGSMQTSNTTTDKPK